MSLMNGDELQRALGRIEGAIEALHQKVDGMSDRVDTHSQRIGALEAWRSFLAGATAVIMTVIGWLVWWNK